MDTLLHDLRVGTRTLRRTPGFALAAVLTLALGIGLATAVYTVAQALLLRRLPVAAQERLVLLTGRTPDGRMDSYPIGHQGTQEFARRSRSLSAVAAVAYEGAVPFTVREEGAPTRLRRAFVSGNYFDVLGARPVLGRALQPDDDVRGAAPVMVLSHRTWQERFGGRADALGRRVTMHENGLTYTVVGVMPQGLDYPRGTDFWAAILPSTSEENLPRMAYHVLGRLAPGAGAEEARQEMTAWFHRADGPPHEKRIDGVARLLPELVLGDTRPAVLAFAAASALLLLITCINVANLLLVRGLGRAREMAVRSALGAGRRRVVTQLLGENLVLAALGGALGLVVAAGAVRLFVLTAPADLPRLDEIALDGGVLAAAVGVTALAMLLFGLAPALLTSRVGAQEVLRAGTRQAGGRRSRLGAEALVALQVALAVVVLSAAGLIGRSLLELQRADLALESRGLLVAELALQQDRYPAPPQQLAMLEQLLPAVAALPGVEAASPVVAAPFAGNAGWDGRPRAEGQTDEQASTNPYLNMEVVVPDYFATIGAPVRRGRGFTDADRRGAAPVVILSESAARHYWPDGDPIGRRLAMGPGMENALTVVGVVPDTRYRDLRDARASIYFPLQQSPFPFAPTNLVVRTAGEPSAVIPSLRRLLAERAPGVTLANAVSFESLLARPLAQPRLNALLLAAFAGAAMLLAAVGLFGVLATMVRQRTRELGVRLALGATAGDLRRLVVGRGLAIAAVGGAVGLLGAVAANRLLEAMLYGVSPTDPATLAAVTLLLLVVAAVATLLPARAGARVDPAVALRTE